jgi:hypothetical protein
MSCQIWVYKKVGRPKIWHHHCSQYHQHMAIWLKIGGKRQHVANMSPTIPAKLHTPPPTALAVAAVPCCHDSSLQPAPHLIVYSPVFVSPSLPPMCNDCCRCRSPSGQTHPPLAHRSISLSDKLSFCYDGNLAVRKRPKCWTSSYLHMCVFCTRARFTVNCYVWWFTSCHETTRKQKTPFTSQLVTRTNSFGQTPFS